MKSTEDTLTDSLGLTEAIILTLWGNSCDTCRAEKVKFVIERGGENERMY
jgi:hypothetical protein